MKSTPLLLASLAIVTFASATTYLEETFSDNNWKDRWTISSAKKDLGVFALSSGRWAANKEEAQGLQTTQDARFYSASTPLNSIFDNSKEDLILQYTVKQEKAQECGGSYIKLLPEGYDASQFSGDSEYAIMFGPDVCGSTNRVHVIFNHKGKNYLTKQEFKVPVDVKTHLYRLTVHPDQKYSLQIDNDVKVDRVSLEEHWEILGPRTIPDPKATKPADWVDQAKIPDPNHVKPANYDSIPRYIPDPEAKQPEDWDTEADGEWEPAEVPNPDFEEWTVKMIDNPAYKGEWKAPEVPNPDYKQDDSLGHYKIGGVGLDLWQVKSGSIFDDIVVTSEKEVAEKHYLRWKKNAALEDVLVEQLLEEGKKAKAEAEEAKKKAEEGGDKKEEAEAEAAPERDELDDEDDEDEGVVAPVAAAEKKKAEAEANDVNVHDEL
ncbi:hypothetical protein BGZ94_003839 [Podila epigama]|nr:hypothetical protein BGZ94_003839 [Podila epigama]